MRTSVAFPSLGITVPDHVDPVHALPDFMAGMLDEAPDERQDVSLPGTCAGPERSARSRILVGCRHGRLVGG